MDKLFILTSTFVDTNTGESYSHIVSVYSTRELAESAKKYAEKFNSYLYFEILESPFITK